MDDKNTLRAPRWLSGTSIKHLALGFLGGSLLGGLACGDGTGPASSPKLEFLAQPSAMGVGSPLAAIVVAATDENGNVIESWTEQIQLSLEAPGGDAQLLGTTEVVPTAGVAVFDSLSIAEAGGGYSLHAQSGSITAVSSDAFSVHDLFISASVTAGYEHACALSSDGKAFCWGRNDQGQSGNGTLNEAYLPTPVATELRFTSISTGRNHTCGKTNDGAAYCWGGNESGQLGNGTTESSTTPQRVTMAVPFDTLDAGRWHTCALAEGGIPYCWGDNWGYQLGDGTDTSRALPTPVAGDLVFTSISAGYIHTCGLVSGTAYCWGSNTYGELGDSAILEPRATPTLVKGDHRFRSIFAGGGTCHGHTCGITTAGDTFCWGTTYQSSNDCGTWCVVPTALTNDPGFSTLTVGGQAVCGITFGGTLHCWGDGYHGQMGTGRIEPVTWPTPILPEIQFTSVSSGAYHTCGVTSDGETYCWGSNTSGQLGSTINPVGWTAPTPVWRP